MNALTFENDGAQLLSGLLGNEEIGDLARLFVELPATRPGVRIAPARIADLPAVRRVTAAITELSGQKAWPVRALLFDKRDGGNWSLGWHQDRTIEVKHRIDVPGFSNWTVKGGNQHVSPPIELLNRMITVRIHVDAVDDENAPLMIVPGSHKLGVIEENRISDVVRTRTCVECLAAAGNVWIYATPILHASARAAVGRRRRVLQLDYASEMLPAGLAWSYAA